MNPHDSRSLDKLFGFNNEPIDLDINLLSSNELVGNQWAKGVIHDKNAPWFKRVIKKRKQNRWWNDGTQQRFCAVCPKGWMAGRLPFNYTNFNNNGESNPRAQQWHLTFADGSDIIIKGLKSWCRDNGVVYSTLYSCWKEHRHYKNYIMEITKV